VYPAVLEGLLSAAGHRTDRYANNRVECDRGRLKARLHAMGGLIRDRSARVIIAGHAFCRTFGADTTSWQLKSPPTGRVAVAFDELVWRSDPSGCFSLPSVDPTQQRHGRSEAERHKRS
jgi:hypothetical protein